MVFSEKIKIKKSLELINSKFQLVMRTGERMTLKMSRWKRMKLPILANCPALRNSDIEYDAMLAQTGVHHYSGKDIELNTECEK